MADYFLSKGLQDWFLVVILFGSDFFLASYFLSDGVYNFDDSIDDADYCSDDSDVEARHTYIDIGKISVIIDVVDNNKCLQYDHAGGVDQFNNDFRFWAVDFINYQIYCEW